MKTISYKNVQYFVGGDEISLSDKYVVIQEDANKDGETVVWGFGTSTEAALADAQKYIDKWNLSFEKKDSIYEPSVEGLDRTSIEKCELCEIALGSFQKKIEVLIFSEKEIPDNLNLAVCLDDENENIILRLNSP